MALKLVYYRHPSLFQKSRLLNAQEFGPELEKYMSEMAILMYSSQGVGLAGNQVNDPRQLIVADLGYVDGQNYGSSLIKIVNPMILGESEDKLTAEEGCLSYPDFAVAVSRATSIKLSYKTPLGEDKIQDFSGWQARILLHEISHLNGETLYTSASKLLKKRYDQKLRKK